MCMQIGIAHSYVVLVAIYVQNSRLKINCQQAKIVREYFRP